MSIARDLRYAARGLRRDRVFTLVVLATLAVGIGLSTAVFSVVRGVILKPLPYLEPDRIVTIWSTNPARGWSRSGVSRQDAADWSRDTRSLAALATYVPQQANVASGDTPARIEYALVTPDLFPVLGVKVRYGRPFDPADNEPGRGAVVILSHAFWRQFTGGDPGIVGRAIALDGRPVTVIGVLEAGVAFPSPTTALWAPFGTTPDETGPRQARWVQAIGRLRSGAGLSEAQAEFDAAGKRLAVAYPETNRDTGILLEPELRAETGGARSALMLLWGAAALLLIVVVANVTNLLLARARGREREIALRASLGAGGASLLRQSLTESLLLAGAGAVLGVLLSAACLTLLSRIGTDLPRLAEVRIDGWVLAYTVAVALAIGCAIGLRPAWSALRVDPAEILRRGGRSIRGVGDGLRRTLVVAQVAVTVIVLVGAGLLFRSFDRLAAINPGFATDGRVTLRLAPDWVTYPDRNRAAALWDDLIGRIGSVAGVERVAAVNRMPLTGNWWTTEYAVDGQGLERGREPTANFRVVVGPYFETMEIPLLEGRPLDQRDGAGTARSTVISRSLARREWPGKSPLGGRINFAPEIKDAPMYTVVGVVDDVRSGSLAEAPTPIAYVSLAQARYGHFGDWGMDVVVRTADSRGALDAVHREVRSLAPTLPVFAVRPLTDLAREDLSQRRFTLLLLGIFGAVAALLAAVGLYGLMTVTVTQRRSELALRLALGADSGSLLRDVVARGARLAMLGTAIGLVAAAGFGRAVASMLYEVRPLDPVTYALVATVILLVALISAWAPAYRASRTEPMEALKAD